MRKLLIFMLSLGCSLVTAGWLAAQDGREQLRQTEQRLQAENQAAQTMTEQALIATAELKFASCEVTWQRTPLLTQIFRYGLKDPCKREWRKIEADIEAHHPRTRN